MFALKKLLVLTLLSVAFSAHTQNVKFINTWNFVQTWRTKTDSLCNEIKKQKIYPARKKGKVKIRNSKDHAIKHKLTSKYKSGQNVVTHNYKFTDGKKIRVIEINGRIMSMDIKWRNRTQDINISSHFTRIGEHSWQWVYKYRIFTNSAAQPYTHEVIINTINNWD